MALTPRKTHSKLFVELSVGQMARKCPCQLQRFQTEANKTYRLGLLEQTWVCPMVRIRVGFVLT
jgi:hypothetical protein